MKRFNFLERIYIILIILILLLAGFSPLIINDGFYSITEEVIEVILIFFLLGLSATITVLLKKETEKSRCLAESTSESLTEAFKYVGRVNIYAKELNSVLTSIKRFPETQHDFKQSLQFMAEKILSVVDVDYVWLRIVDTVNANILSELFFVRGNRNIPPPTISNRDLISSGPVKDFVIISSDSENVSSRVFAVLPAKNISGEQTAVIKAAVSQIQMIFLIFSLGHYKISKQ